MPQKRNPPEAHLLIIPPLEVPLHGGRHLCGVHLSEVRSHHLGHAPVAGTQVQQPVGPPLGRDPQQPAELIGGEHEHGAPAQQPERGQKGQPGRHTRRG